MNARPLVAEFVGTFALVFIGAGTVVVSGKAGLAAGAAIGLTLTFAIFLGGNLTGASLNPARTLGPAVVSGDYSDIWIYFVGPVLGGIVAALLYRYLRTPAES